METKKEPTVPAPATLRHGSENPAPMTKEQFEREKRYQAALAVARSMHAHGVVDEEDFRKIEARLTAKFQPVFGGFLF